MNERLFGVNQFLMVEPTHIGLQYRKEEEKRKNSFRERCLEILWFITAPIFYLLGTILLWIISAIIAFLFIIGSLWMFMQLDKLLS